MNYEKIMRNLKKRGFRPYLADTVETAIDYIFGIIPNGCSIGFGGSMTIWEMNLLERMKDNYTLLHRDLFPAAQHASLINDMHTADWYISSANAITEEGELINIDGRANRVTETLHGPKNVLFIAGVNKIAATLSDGIDRARNVASPLNAKRLNKKTPCVKTGKCEYCNSYDTICKVTVIHHHPTTDKNVYVLLVNESLGY